MAGKKMLWVSPFMPYDRIGHAGGKNHNYYIKYFQKLNVYEITLITMSYEKEKNKFDLEQYGIQYDCYLRDTNWKENYCRKLIDLFPVLYPIDKKYELLPPYEKHQLLKRIKAYLQKNGEPEIIILQWTAMIYFLPYLKKTCKKSKIILIEEDVTFLSYYRKYMYERRRLSRTLRKYQYEKLKAQELRAINIVDLAVVINSKDYKLLVQNGVPENKLFESGVYFDKYDNAIRKPEKDKLLFFGAMARKENEISVLWFIDQVMPLLGNKYRLYVVGANPSTELQNRQSDEILVEGFVEDVSQYMESCLCMVVPLQLGAGIKVKVLEGMSAGIPVLTNSIGIEGIEAQDGEDYIYCETPLDYAEAIKKLAESRCLTDQIGRNARSFILRECDLGKKLESLNAKISCLN